MIAFTAPDGTKVAIDPERVLRARRVVAGEGAPGAQTRIDWVGMQFVQEPIDEVAAQIASFL